MTRSVGTLGLRIALVAVAYLVTGKLALLLAIPPGYATAIWPPAGIALAAAILWGGRVLPGVWLGAFVVNLTLGGGLPAATLIGVGAALQAATGAWIVRRIAGPGNPLDSGQSPLRALFTAGPLSGLVGASIAIATLTLLGLVPVSDAAFSWFTWWAGDLIGVLAFLPPMLAWKARPLEIWKRRRWTVAGPLSIGFTAVVLFFVYARSIERQRERAEVDQRQRPIAEAIHRNLTRAADTVVALGSFFDSSEKVTREEFSVFTAPSLRLGLGLRAMSWNPIVGASAHGGRLAGARDEGLGDVSLLEFGPGRSFVPARERPRHAPVLYIEPEADNRYMAGFDILCEPDRRTAVESAIDHAAPTATAPIDLVQATGTARGVLLVMPVYEAADPPETVEERRRTVLGVVVGALRIHDLVEDALVGLDPRDLVVRIRDLDAIPGNQLLFGAEPEDPGPRHSPHEVGDAGRRWRIEIDSAGPSPRAWSTWFLLFGGLLITALLGAFVLELSMRQIQVERLVALRTGELGRANDELQRSNIELQRFAHVASHDLREPLRTIAAYAQLLDESSPGLTPESRGYLARVVGASRRMHELVDDLLALSRLEGGATGVSLVDLRLLADLARENLHTAVTASEARIEVGELPTVLCDPSQIIQLFQNLIANAVKFSRDGVRPEISITSRRSGAYHEISIRDNGIGIAEEDHQRVFEMFRRLQGRERYGGTGMGLAICRKVVERHGGRIWLESPPEGGCVFRFTLPAERSPG